jgi:inorganic pyrophosphatase
VKEYDIFVPLRYNDGRPIEARKFQQLQEQLLRRFGGLTYFPQANQGYWKLGDVTYRDEIVIYRVLAANSRGAKAFLRKLKEQLKAELVQEEILIVERDVDAL